MTTESLNFSKYNGINCNPITDDSVDHVKPCASESVSLVQFTKHL